AAHVRGQAGYLSIVVLRHDWAPHGPRHRGCGAPLGGGSTDVDGTDIDRAARSGRGGHDLLALRRHRVDRPVHRVLRRRPQVAGGRRIGMSVGMRIALGLGLFLAVTGIVFAVTAHEWRGTVLLLVCAVSFTYVGLVLRG